MSPSAVHGLFHTVTMLFIRHGEDVSITLQLSLHTGAGRSATSCSTAAGLVLRPDETLLSCPQLAMVFIGRPMFTLQQYVPDPVAVSPELMLLFQLRARVELQIFARLSHPPVTRRHRRGGGASGGDQGAGRRRGCPRHRGAADRVRALNLRVPGPVGAGEDGDATVGRRAREGQAELVRSPRDGVDGRVVEGRGEVDGREHALLDSFRIITCDRTNKTPGASNLGGPKAHPDRPVVPGQVREQRLLLAGDIEHLDGAVDEQVATLCDGWRGVARQIPWGLIFRMYRGSARRRTHPAVVVVLTVMDLVGMTGFERRRVDTDMFRRWPLWSRSR